YCGWVPGSNSKSGIRFKNSSMAIRISNRARCSPRQRWEPIPKKVRPRARRRRAAHPPGRLLGKNETDDHRPCMDVAVCHCEGSRISIYLRDVERGQTSRMHLVGVDL